MKEKRLRSASSDNRFAFYHQNEALLFQFLLHECLRAHQILRKKPDRELLLKIVGQEEPDSEGWHAPIGHLPRLLHFCSLLVAHFADSSAALCKNLKPILEKVSPLQKKCYSILKEEKKNAEKGVRYKHGPIRKHKIQYVTEQQNNAEDPEDMHNQILQLYPLLRKELRNLMNLLFVKLHDFRDNASVLFFLLRHQEQFDAFYREPIIKKTFETFFPEGVKQAQSFLVEKFSKKGFLHLIPYIEYKLKLLEAVDDLDDE